ncbi:MAG: prolyl oligopeptidase family serine peptidase [Proteobacteria bacterium]|nr:prolyl oligopeptidase family serine peptidase [Pseudomonadota bacterium]
MKEPLIEDYGNWPSPITPNSLVEGVRGIGSLQYDSGFVYWLESRPEEAGRQTIMRWHQDSGVEEILPAPFNARSRVHEYGGTSYAVQGNVIWFSQFDDQRLYRMTPGGTPEPITAESSTKSAIRFAACKPDISRNRLICVREDHRAEGEPRNELVAVSMDGSDQEGEILFAQSDFVSAPQLSPDGSSIAFVSWMHPNMPWDNTTLWSANFKQDGSLSNLTEHNSVTRESVIDPKWSDSGDLYALTDRSNWWSLNRVSGDTFDAVAHNEEEVEIGGPMWALGTSYYAFSTGNSAVAVINRGGVEHLSILDLQGKGSNAIPIPGVTGIGSMMLADDRIVAVLAYANKPSELVSFKTDGTDISVIRTTSKSADPAWSSPYQLVTFPTGDGTAVAHGIYLPPQNPDVSAPANRTPPLIPSNNGGPTGVSSPGYSLAQQFWTSRGFAILDLNYRGSTGFGREYRRALYGNWGVADVEDAVAGAKWLSDQKLADPARLIIRGGSAGGFTVLAAHAFHNTFSAGASHYGVSDLTILAKETHKFESRYIDQVIGPYPEFEHVYQERSPINHLDNFNAPLIMLQGLDDKVVPPNQSEMIYEALKARGVPTAYVSFEGEGHGFRKAENIVHAIQAELYFYSRVLNMPVADDLPVLKIDNLQDDKTGKQ